MLILLINFIIWLSLLSVIMHAQIGQKQHQSRSLYNGYAYGLVLDYAN